MIETEYNNDIHKRMCINGLCSQQITGNDIYAHKHRVNSVSYIGHRYMFSLK